MTGEQRRAFAVKRLKENLDGITHFACRYTITDGNVPTVEDAIKDRNVQHGEATWHVIWIVKKPVERMLIVTDKNFLRSRWLAWMAPQVEIIRQEPVDPATGKALSVAKTKVFGNTLWDGTYQLNVGAAVPVLTPSVGSGKACIPVRPEHHLRVKPSSIQAPPNYGLAENNGVKVCFAGMSTCGLWQFDMGRDQKKPGVKTWLDPDHGFLPVKISRWVQWHKGEGYIDWHATHFEKTANGRWMTTRSISGQSARRLPRKARTKAGRVVPRVQGRAYRHVQTGSRGTFGDHDSPGPPTSRGSQPCPYKNVAGSRGVLSRNTRGGKRTR